MEFNEYQKETRKHAIYPGLGNNFSFPTIGLAGETGEVAEKIKKIIRDKDGVVDDISRIEVKKELGDVLWYLSQIASEFELSLDDVANHNIEKIRSRSERNVTHGNGDNR
ncbi:MAG: nucleoside triphosphate pyrophosphohydrolase family protein [Candidatus Moranbacteria bacterium]|nr:nucleoside triphosphate pyrophosphohydrolase family protein [Candidatus Moranbacteria bacterium]